MKQNNTIIIIQEKIPFYRISFFEKLRQSLPREYSICLITKQAALSRGSKNFREKFYPTYWAFPILRILKLQKQFHKAARIVLPFDIRNVCLYQCLLFFPKKTILWGHGYGKNTWLNPIRYFLAKRAKSFISYEKGILESYKKKGIPSVKLYFTGNTIDVPNPHRSDNKRSSFLFVGRLQKRKNLRHLLRAFSRIKSEIPEKIMIKIIGEGPERSALEALSEELSIQERVQYIGNVQDSNSLAEHFSSAIAYVSPGWSGLGILHSFAHGVPVISTSAILQPPEFENIIDRKTGILFDGSIRQLSEVLKELIDNEALAVSMGESALKRYQTERSMDLMVIRFLTGLRLEDHKS